MSSGQHNQRMNWIGRVVDGRFEVLSSLGAGGMGQVFLARQIHMDRQVALKIIKEELSEDSRAVERFYREARAAARVNHPNIVQIFLTGIDAGHLFLALEYVEGVTLADTLREQGHLSRVVVLRIASQVAEALAHAHKAGLVHRDLKPDNIMLTDGPSGDLHVKVLDFGIAKIIADKQDTSLTRPGTVCGTPGYMAPEQIRGQATDYRADLYAFGVVLYKMLTGDLPFLAETPLEYVQKTLTEDVRPPSETHPELRLDGELEALIMQCLARAPEDRRLTSREVADRLTLHYREGSFTSSDGFGDSAPSLRVTSDIALEDTLGHEVLAVAPTAPELVYRAPTGAKIRADLASAQTVDLRPGPVLAETIDVPVDRHALTQPDSRTKAPTEAVVIKEAPNRRRAGLTLLLLLLLLLVAVLGWGGLHFFSEERDSALLAHNPSGDTTGSGSAGRLPMNTDYEPSSDRRDPASAPEASDLSVRSDARPVVVAAADGDPVTRLQVLPPEPTQLVTVPESLPIPVGERDGDVEARVSERETTAEFQANRLRGHESEASAGGSLPPSVELAVVDEPEPEPTLELPAEEAAWTVDDPLRLDPEIKLPVPAQTTDLSVGDDYYVTGHLAYAGQDILTFYELIFEARGWAYRRSGSTLLVTEEAAEIAVVTVVELTIGDTELQVALRETALDVALPEPVDLECGAVLPADCTRLYGQELWLVYECPFDVELMVRFIRSHYRGGIATENISSDDTSYAMTSNRPEIDGFQWLALQVGDVPGQVYVSLTLPDIVFPVIPEPIEGLRGAPAMPALAEVSATDISITYESKAEFEVVVAFYRMISVERDWDFTMEQDVMLCLIDAGPGEVYAITGEAIEGGSLVTYAWNPE